MSNVRWADGVAVLLGSAVGSVLETARKEWEAFGCEADWQDTQLGIFQTESAAKRAVEYWVEVNL